MSYIRPLYIEVYIDMYTALYLYIGAEPCTKKPYVEGARKTVRTSTEKRHFRVDLPNVVSISSLYLGWCLFATIYERALRSGRQVNGTEQHFEARLPQEAGLRSETHGNVANISFWYVRWCWFGIMYERALRRGLQENGKKNNKKRYLR